MLRRTFFKTLSSSTALALLPKWSRAQASATSVSLHDIAVVVLPSSLGPKRTDDAVAGFERWVAGYKAHVDAGYGYGHTRLSFTGPNPSAHYDEQLKQLEAAATAKGGRFATLSSQDKKDIIQAVLTSAGVTAITPKPNGKHVASDLMSYFYSSSDGMDFCYGVAIRESDCRGLGGSDKRPPALT